MNEVGLHLRLEESFFEVAQKAKRLNLKIFQNFLINTSSGRYIKLDDKDIKNFLSFRQYFDETYLHSSFWINLCSESDYANRFLKHEILQAKRMDYTHIVLHAGSAKG